MFRIFVCMFFIFVVVFVFFGGGIILVQKFDFFDCQVVFEMIENFYIGDYIGSVEYKKFLMYFEGVYCYVDEFGKYCESQFCVDLDDFDDQYMEELLSVDIYENVVLVWLWFKQNFCDVVEYKLMILYKVEEKWFIISIFWGFGVIF